MLGWLILTGVALLAGGGVAGYFYGISGLPRMIAHMTPAEVDALADRVAELRGADDGAS